VPQPGKWTLWVSCGVLTCGVEGPKAPMLPMPPFQPSMGGELGDGAEDGGEV